MPWTIFGPFRRSLAVRPATRSTECSKAVTRTIGNPSPPWGKASARYRIRDEDGAFRVVYVARFADAVYVLHCFQKRTQKTSKANLDLAARRYRDLVKDRAAMSKQRFDNVWDAIEDTPAQAENMRLRSALMIALKEHIAHEGLSQSQAAKVFGVTQPRVSDLMRGKIDLFGLDSLVNMAAAAGLHLELHIARAA